MLKRYFAKKSISELELPSPPSKELERNILRQLAPIGLPSLPTKSQAVFKAATDPKSETSTILNLIQSDESLTARVLKISNSAYFNRGVEISSIVDALGIVGIEEIKSILSCSSLTDLFPSNSNWRKKLWQHNITTAIISKFLAVKLNLNQQNCFTAGLLHDIGKLLLIQRFGKPYEATLTASDTEAAELNLYPFSHTQVGYLIAKKWNLSETISRAILYHHSSADEIKNLKEILIVASANLLSKVFAENKHLNREIISDYLIRMELNLTIDQLLAEIKRETMSQIEIYEY